MGMRPLFASTRASRAWHISSGRTTHLNLHFSPAFCCGRRCTAPSGVFSLRGARRTVKYDSAPARSGRGPQYRPLRAPWPRIPGAATMAMSSIAEERQRRSRGHGAATLRADGGRGRSLRCSSSKMLGHRLPPRALISAHEPHRRTALGAPAGPPWSKTSLGTAPRRPRHESW